MLNPIIYLKSVDKLGGNKALDLGCGDGFLAKKLAEQHGFKVDAVDIKSQEIEGVNFTQSDIRNFEIKENNYDLIICKNVLPFLASRQEVEDMVAKMYAGLKENGVMYFSLFGTRDPWVKEHPHMTFVDDFVPPGKEICRSEFYGLGTTRKGALKIWHKFDFVVGK